MSDSTHDLLIRGTAAARAGEEKEARFHLEWMLDLDPDEEEKLEAWYWLAKVCQNKDEKRRFLEEVLAAQPYHLLARREWMLLQGKLDPEEIINPNEIQAPSPDGNIPNLDRFTCPNCGGRMVFSPDGTSLVCEYCDARKIQQKSSPDGEQDFLLSMATIKGHGQPEGQTSFICQGCGAGFILVNMSLTINCPYCHTVYVVDQVETRQQAAPSAIFPGRISSQVAVTLFDQWRTEHQIPSPDEPIQIQGIYLPVWWFALGGQIHYRYQMKEKNKPAISFSGSRPVLCSDIMVPASNHYIDDVQDMIKRLNPDDMTDFKTDYLADWLAETYQISVGDASLKARQLVFQQEKQDARSGIPGAAEDISYSSHELMVESYQLVLIPGWVGECSISGQTCKLFVDGLTGDVDLDGAIHKKQPSFWEKLKNWSGQ